MSATIRRGLPRAAGGDPWPPASEVVGGSLAAGAPEVATLSDRAPSPAERDSENLNVAAHAEVASPERAPQPIASVEAQPHTRAEATPSGIRRGLPRAAGGDLWPPASEVRQRHSAGASVADSHIAATPADAVEPASVRQRQNVGESVADPQIAASEPAVRRGLPRAADGEPWPPAGTTPRPTAVQGETSISDAAPSLPATTAAATSAPASVAPATTAPARVAPAASLDGPRVPLAVPKTVWAGRSAGIRPARKPEPIRIGPFTKAQWAGIVIIGGGGLLFAAALAVVFVRAFLSLDVMQGFLTTYPGEYHLPEGAPVGFPAWLGWQHFFNAFLMVLIIRTGLTIRTEKRPTAFWTPRRDPKGKTSLTIWFHQSLDVLWLVNGVVFVALLFVTGQWMRIIPTSWEVFPNALSAALQYVSLDWPTENGWVNYNALQQLAYFATVFLAAPLAAITGYRMSGMWPKDNARLNAAYPVEWARKIHFPVMLYFVVFIFIHVALVLSTGALRNLNHMYAAQGSVDGVAYADNWTGFWMFVASLVVIAAAWVAARPLVLAPIARLFGTVSGR